MIYRVIIMIITVNSGDTLYSLSRQYALPVEKIISDNGITDEILVTGQSLIIEIPESSVTTSEETTVGEISREYGIDERQLFRNNYILGGRQQIPKGTYLALTYKDAPNEQKIIGGYAYDFIGTDRLYEVINYLTYIMPFTYGFTGSGELITVDDRFIIETAREAGTKVLMHISTLTDEGVFDSNLPSLIFENNEVQTALLDNIISEVILKGYDGVDIDFEFLPLSEKEGYISFTRMLSERLREIGKILVIAVPPKNSDEQEGLLVEGIDYSALGENADYIMIMAYEYGYKFGPAMAIAPTNQVRNVLDYAVTKIPSEKILLGISNYGYDWTLPYVRGESDAPSISTTEAVNLANEYGAEILFDTLSSAPYFFYTDSEGLVHEVWFEDARSFEAKMNLIKEYNLAGGFIWDLMRENPQGYVTINSLTKIL